ncbi:MAG: class I SAM-dependent methyltransferase [Phycisphaerales bacterium]|nr:class I SAM-dependent methyltransferase [Phycisphaerales bacterium]
MTETYRKHFTDQAKATDYDSRQYAAGTYGEITWRMEQEQLAHFAAQFRQSHPWIDYLDFAAGTGRIISFMEEKVDSATGIEISQQMIDVARTKVKHAKLIRADITEPNSSMEGKYDLITAFRFILNAEPSLRLAAFKALATRLKGPDSRLVFNNHGNLMSHKLIMWPFHELRNLGKGHRSEGNCMTHRQVLRLAHQAGLEIEAVWGSAVLGNKSMRILSSVRVERLERKLMGLPLLAQFGVNQMYVARRA